MATYSKVPRGIPSHQRVAKITSVAAGDYVDVEEILGRPARGMIIETTSSTDSVSYRLNNYPRVVKPVESGPDEIVNVGPLTSAAYPEFTSVGDVIELQDEIDVQSFEITAVALGTGSTVTVTIW